MQEDGNAETCNNSDINIPDTGTYTLYIISINIYICIILYGSILYIIQCSMRLKQLVKYRVFDFLIKKTKAQKFAHQIEKDNRNKLIHFTKHMHPPFQPFPPF